MAKSCRLNKESKLFLLSSHTHNLNGLTWSVARPFCGDWDLGDLRVGRGEVGHVANTCAVGVVVTGEEGRAARVAGGEVGEAVTSTHRLDVVHVTLTTKVTAVGQIDLESLG